MSEFVVCLEGLGCPNCAAKIERETQNLKEVKEANLNFANQTMFIEHEDIFKKEEIFQKIEKIVHSHEKDVKVFLKNGENYKITKVHNHEHDDCCAHAHGHEHDDCCGHTHEHSHSHSHNHNHDDNVKKEIIRFGIGLGVFGIALLAPFDVKVKFFIFIVSYVIFGYDVLTTSVKNIVKGDFFDENFLMSVATIGAFILGEYTEAVAVMLFYQIGEILQDIAVGRSRKSIKAIMDIRPDFAHKVTNDGIETVNPEKIKIGDIILVKAGEKVPLDGIIEEGSTMLDTMALTGESVPRKAEVGDEILSGCINQTGVIKIKVNKNFGDSTVSKILEMVENASSRKAPTEKFITKFAKYYTPAVVFLALAVAIIPPIITKEPDLKMWVSRALIMLVISCPCAIVVSIPLSFFNGIGLASSRGILIKGSNHLQALTQVDTVVMDKTGTLTEGVFEVVKSEVFNGYTQEELLKYTAVAEYHSTHPIATSIVSKYDLGEDKKLLENGIESYEEIAGQGVKVKAYGKEILVGNLKMMDRFGVDIKEVQSLGTVVYTVIDGVYAGNLIISDKIKKSSKSAVESLKKSGIETVMLTGDTKKVGEGIAKELAIDKVYTELLPNDKVEKLENIITSKEKGKVIFVGDGINDAPVLARADIGIAMGGAGSDAAVEAADIVLMQDDVSKVEEAIKIARHTNKLVWENIIFSLGVKGIVLVMGAMGYANMWLAVFADVGVTLIAVINSMRKYKI